MGTLCSFLQHQRPTETCKALSLLLYVDMATTVKKGKRIEFADLSAHDSAQTPHMENVTRHKPDTAVTLTGTLNLNVLTTYVGPNINHNRRTQKCL